MPHRLNEYFQFLFPGVFLMTRHNRRRADDPEDFDPSEIRFDESVPAQHCSEHSGNMEFYRTVNTKLNWCLGGVGFILTVLLGFAKIVYDSGRAEALLSASVTQNTVDIAKINQTLPVIMQQLNDHENTLRFWQNAEKFVHGTGIEQHHVDELKGKRN
jgi:hypothetical protein